jgi:pimeloyl-ACP methyl ester carboxylesterase
VLLHGFGAGSSFWFRTLAPLVGEGYTVHALDWRGCGLSGRPPFTAKTHDQAIAFFMDGLEAWRTAEGVERFVLCGHSMGGQASTISAGAACAAQWDIRAAALIHPAAGDLPGGSNSGAGMSVPTAAFTSTGDHLCSPASVAATMQAFNASAAGQTLPSLYRNVQGWSHLEPVMGVFFENPLLSTYTAAWFKIMLNKDAGVYRDLIYGGGPDSVCHSEPMVSCYAVNEPAQ